MEQKVNLDAFLYGVKTVAVRCLQWGDTGKGKIVDILAPWADVGVRCTGANNAGHTFYVNGKKIVLHLVPSSIAEDSRGKVSIIGPGTAVYPKFLIDELRFLDSQGLSYDNLKISLRAKLILPTHIVEDRVKEISLGNGKIGTTGKGVGPVYSDHVSRIGLVVNDLLNKELFAIKLKKHLEIKKALLKGFAVKDIYSIMQSDDLGGGSFFDKYQIFNFESIFNEYMLMADKLKSMIFDTDKYLKEIVGEKKILLEGAQGMLLSNDYGTYPFVTSSDPSLEGMAKGAGINCSDIDLDLGIIKGFMQTRVGNGPFPTELGGFFSEDYCAKKTRDNELKEYPDAFVNDSSEFIQGVALRRKGQEFGATTGRLRRVGWLDLPLLKYCLRHGSDKTKLILTKLDVLDECKEIKICTGYKYTGPDFNYGSQLIIENGFIREAIMDSDFLKFCEPIYEVFPGWEKDTTLIREFNNLPENLRNILNFILLRIGKDQSDVKIISVGPEREQTIFM
ncbi:adenylosuccinate synthetase [bacterium]|nr:adenylosuccinate synthetase [bacterium]